MGKCSSQIQDEHTYDYEDSNTITASDSSIVDFSHIEHSSQYDAQYIIDEETCADYQKHVHINDTSTNQTENVINHIISCSGNTGSSYTSNSNGFNNNQIANNHSSNGFNDSNQLPNGHNQNKNNENRNDSNKNDKPYKNVNANNTEICNVQEHDKLVKTTANMRCDIHTLKSDVINLKGIVERLEQENYRLKADILQHNDEKYDEFETKMSSPIKQKQKCAYTFVEQEIISKEPRTIAISRICNKVNNINKCIITNRPLFTISRRDTKSSNPDNNQSSTTKTVEKRIKNKPISTDKSKMLSDANNFHCNKECINISSYFTRQVLPKKIKENLVHINEYMERIEQLYANEFINWYCSDTVGIINYSIHCLKSGKPLYVVYRKQYNKNTKTMAFTQTNCYTESELMQQYPEILHEIWTKPLPKILHIPNNLTPQLNATRNIVELLRDKEKREQLFKNTKWTRVDVSEWKYKTPTEVIVNITQKEFVANLNCYIQQQTQKPNGIQLIPIISNALHLQYALSVPVEVGHIRFYVAVSFTFIDCVDDDDEKEFREDAIKVSGIYLNIYDEHQLVQTHHQNGKCKFKEILNQFECSVNYLQIGTNKKKEMNAMMQLQTNYQKSKRELKKCMHEKKMNRKANVCENCEKSNEEKTKWVQEKKQREQYLQNMIIENQKVLNMTGSIIKGICNQMM